MEEDGGKRERESAACSIAVEWWRVTLGASGCHSQINVHNASEWVTQPLHYVRRSLIPRTFGNTVRHLARSRNWENVLLHRHENNGV